MTPRAGHPPLHSLDAPVFPVVLLAAVRGMTPWTLVDPPSHAGCSPLTPQMVLRLGSATPVLSRAASHPPQGDGYCGHAYSAHGQLHTWHPTKRWGNGGGPLMSAAMSAPRPLSDGVLNR